MNLALRTLEYWVDTLNPEYLEPAMADVMPALMHALWAHLRPPPYPFGPKVRLQGRPHGSAAQGCMVCMTIWCSHMVWWGNTCEVYSRHGRHTHACARVPSAALLKQRALPMHILPAQRSPAEVAGHPCT